jgi:hypothetical protein
MSITRIRLSMIAIVLLALMLGACSGAGEEIEPTSTPLADVMAEDEPAPSGEESSSDADLGTGACANLYYPVILGVNWTYNASGSSIDPYSFTSTVSEVLSDRFTVTTEFDDLTIVQHWECKPEGLVALELGGGAAATLVSGDVDLVLETENVSGVTLPTSISAGDTWTHSLELVGDVNLGGDMSGTAEGTANSNFQAIGMETVDVGAGAFEALRIDSEFTLDMMVSTEGISIPVTFTSTGSTYYAAGVGWVLSTSDGSFAGFSTTSTQELQDFLIP